ncbi:MULTISPECIES: hypothetical protein [unclassified Stenotrophomonas]|uniref:hypothetical protein n=1 Tax=unclassified Stenotrophomonas TaxID=196198 RepID=UPI002447E2FE|nr:MULTISPECIES: hypothetical protein [unclassified Stenotrophomonas]MDH0277287.1 hypothetical protein [Stenotrophomonas sp. GD04089]MDH1911575.1 hypothetical protein [Stenotrophomonas sp. GD03794]
MSKESIQKRARKLLSDLCLLPIRKGQDAEIALIVAALSPQWQPIESAPKGQEVLVWRPDQGVFIAMIATPDMVMSESDIEECCLPEDFEEWYCEAWGWLEDDLRPTQWMPKPAEPEAV